MFSFQKPISMRYMICFYVPICTRCSRPRLEEHALKELEGRHGLSFNAMDHSSEIFHFKDLHVAKVKASHLLRRWDLHILEVAWSGLSVLWLKRRSKVDSHRTTKCPFTAIGVDHTDLDVGHGEILCSIAMGTSLPLRSKTMFQADGSGSSEGLGTDTVTSTAHAGIPQFIFVFRHGSVLTLRFSQWSLVQVVAFLSFSPRFQIFDVLHGPLDL